MIEVRVYDVTQRRFGACETFVVGEYEAERLREEYNARGFVTLLLPVGAVEDQYAIREAIETELVSSMRLASF